ncbi:MAG: preprotein translocase subunit SecE [Coxiellaceae bacterium]|jgi:preprotein translocase subunit SecE|nr:preprotein translocase subunit SecE [Coxiellaceae bacterium]
MEETKSVSHSKLDVLCWILVCILILTGIAANYYFRELIWSLRFAVWIVLVGVLLGLAALTTQGRKIWGFIKNAQIELRKVVWPTREETVKTTAIVALLVFIMSLILWAFDSILLWIISCFTR